jgi:hypothetical protein
MLLINAVPMLKEVVHTSPFSASMLTINTFLPVIQLATNENTTWSAYAYIQL